MNRGGIVNENFSELVGVGSKEPIAVVTRRLALKTPVNERFIVKY